MAKITEQQFNNIKLKIAERACQLCKSKQWIINDEIVSVQLNPYIEGGVAISSANVPALRATCHNCGQIVFLDARVLGIVN